jgi:hypothetical protein
MNPVIEKIDKINQILGNLKSQTGAIAFITNPQGKASDMADLSDFFYCMSNQIDDVMDLVNELPVKTD